MAPISNYNSCSYYLYAFLTSKSIPFEGCTYGSKPPFTIVLQIADYCNEKVQLKSRMCIIFVKLI